MRQSLSCFVSAFGEWPHVAQRKLVIIGSGNVGMSLAFAAVMDGIAEQITIISRTKDKAVGEMLDLSHGSALLNPVEVRIGDYADCADADAIVVTAGAKQKPDESRLDLTKRNIELFEGILINVLKFNPSPLLVIVTNPVDILTYVAVKKFGLARERVIGAGTVLDSARLRYLIGRAYRVDPSDVNAFAVGEHGDSQVVLWSLATIGGVPLSAFQAADSKAIAVSDLQEMVADLVRDAAFYVIRFKGSTYYAISIATLTILRAILRNENAILSVSTMLQGQYGVADVAMALPCVINARGCDRILTPALTGDEQAALHRSADAIRSVIAAHEGK
jgi:L-lactate dehydrogenase